MHVYAQGYGLSVSLAGKGLTHLVWHLLDETLRKWLTEVCNKGKKCHLYQLIICMYIENVFHTQVANL